MCGGDKDRATGVASLTNEEPLMVMESSIDIVWKVVREDGGYGCNSVVGKGEAPLHRGGSRSIHEGAFGTENGDVSCDPGSGGHWGLEVLASRGGDKDVVGVNGNVLVKWGKEESVKDFPSYSGGSGRHCRRERGRLVRVVLL